MGEESAERDGGKMGGKGRKGERGGKGWKKGPECWEEQRDGGVTLAEPQTSHKSLNFQSFFSSDSPVLAKAKVVPHLFFVFCQVDFETLRVTASPF